MHTLNCDWAWNIIIYVLRTLNVYKHCKTKLRAHFILDFDIMQRSAEYPKGNDTVVDWSTTIIKKLAISNMLYK